MLDRHVPTIGNMQTEETMLEYSCRGIDDATVFLSRNWRCHNIHVAQLQHDMKVMAIHLTDVREVRFRQQGTWNRKKEEAENLPLRSAEVGRALHFCIRNVVGGSTQSNPSKMFVTYGSCSSQSLGLYLLSKLAPTPFTITWPEEALDDSLPSFLQGLTCTYETSPCWPSNAGRSTRVSSGYNF